MENQVHTTNIAHNIDQKMLCLQEQHKQSDRRGHRERKTCLISGLKYDCTTGLAILIKRIQKRVTTVYPYGTSINSRRATSSKPGKKHIV